MWAESETRVQVRFVFLTALFIVEVNDIIPLCTVMKQFNEDEAATDALVPRDSANAASLGGHTSPATVSVFGRGEGAEGAEGGRSRKGTSVSTGPSPHSWDSQWPHPADLDHGIA